MGAARISAALARKLGLTGAKAKRVKAQATKIEMPLRGEPCQEIWLDLPYPPHVNQLYPTHKNRRILSERGKEYHEAVGAVLVVERVGHVIGRLTVEIWLHEPDDGRTRDIDGAVKVILDSFQKSGVFRNDSQVDHLYLHRADREANGRVCVHIRGELPG